MRILILVIIGLAIFSCNQSPNNQDRNVIQDTAAQTTINQNTKINTITNLLDKALTIDTLEVNNSQPFLFFKSGNFLSKTEKNALVVRCPTDTTYSVKLYSIKANSWFLCDSIVGLEAVQLYFNPIFDDYNFDGQQDIFIRVTSTNGWMLEYGHLLIIDPLSKKLIIHREAMDLANMKPDTKTKTIISELCNSYDGLQGKYQLTIFSNKWVNGQLKTISKKDITIKPE